MPDDFSWQTDKYAKSLDIVPFRRGGYWPFSYWVFYFSSAFVIFSLWMYQVYKLEARHFLNAMFSAKGLSVWHVFVCFIFNEISWGGWKILTLWGFMDIFQADPH